MSERGLKVAVILRLVDRMTRPLRPLVGAFAALRGKIGSVGENMAVVTAGLSRMKGGLIAAGAAFAGVGGAATLAASQLVRPAAEFETFMAILTALEGSSEKAEAAFQWVRTFATNTPLQLQGVLDAYQKLKTFGLDPMDGTLQAMVDTNAKMGGSQEKLEGIILAVGQAWTKQKLQGEEALQLIERGVPVWDLLAEATGQSVVELQKLSSAGELGRREIALLVKAMGKNAAGAAEAQMKTWRGMVSNLQDLWANFQLEIMQGGLFDWMKGRLSELLTTVNEMAADGRLQALAEQIGANIQRVLVVLWELAVGLHSTFQTAGVWLEWAAEKLGGWTELVLAFTAVPFAGTLVSIVTGLALVAKGLVAVSALLAANPITLAISAIAGGVYLIYENWGGITQWFEAKISAVAAAFEHGLIWGLIELWREFNVVTLIYEALDGLVHYLTGYSLDFSWADILPSWSWSDIIPDLPSFFSGDGAAPKAGRSGQIGRRALGGSVFAGRLYEVGEQGVELFAPTVDGRVTPHRDLVQAAPAAAPVQVGEIHVHAAPGMSPIEVAKAVRDELARAALGPDRALHDGGRR
ncbi:MAG: tape measure protein [Pseudomonadota bacterium]